MDPPADGAHAAGAPLRPPSGRPPLRAHRVPSPRTKPTVTRSPTRSLAELPYHPHIQHVQPESTYWYLQAVPELMALISCGWSN